MLYLMLGAACASRVFPDKGEWVVELDVVSNARALRAVFPFAFVPDATAEKQVLYVVERHKVIKRRECDVTDGDMTLSLPALVDDPRRWAYCGGRMSTNMPRECRSGDPVLSGLRCAASVCVSPGLGGVSVSFTADKHRLPLGLLYSESGTLILTATAANTDVDEGGGPVWKPGDVKVISVLAEPRLRVSVVDETAEVWVELDSVDTAGSIMVCGLVVIALANLTRSRIYTCGGCNTQFGSVDVLLAHCITPKCSDGVPCTATFEDATGKATVCSEGMEWHRHVGGGGQVVSLTPLHVLQPARVPLRSHIGAKSGISGSLRLSFALIATALWSALSESGSVVVGEEDMGDAVWLLLVLVGVVSVASLAAWIVSYVMFAANRRLESAVWAHVAYTTCEILLLGTLAYSIPKGYGSDIVVASLFLAGVGSAAIVGRAGVEIFREVWADSSKLSTGHILSILAVAASTIALIVTLMVYPMLVKSTGLSFVTSWFVSTHLVVCIVTLPCLSLVV